MNKWASVKTLVMYRCTICLIINAISSKLATMYSRKMSYTISCIAARPGCLSRWTKALKRLVRYLTKCTMQKTLRQQESDAMNMTL